MGLVLSLRTVFELARITLPTFLEGVTTGVEREDADARVRAFGRRFVDLARVDLDVVGVDAIEGETPYVYMSNHQSHTDIPILCATVPARSLRFVAKTELFRVPIWGRAMRASDVVEVDRSDRDKAIESLRRAGELIASGISVWIAPEGSRSPTGEVHALKKGGFHLARETGTPIVPIAISGTRNILPKGTTRMAYDVPVRVVFGRPIAVEGRSLEELIAEVGAFLEAHVVPEGPA